MASCTRQEFIKFEELASPETAFEDLVDELNDIGDGKFITCADEGCIALFSQ